MSIGAIFTPDAERNEGVRPINIYLLRLIYFLMLVFDPSPGPRFALIRGRTRCAWAVHPDVPEDLAGQLDAPAGRSPRLTPSGMNQCTRRGTSRSSGVESVGVRTQREFGWRRSAENWRRPSIGAGILLQRRLGTRR